MKVIKSVTYEVRSPYPMAFSGSLVVGSAGELFKALGLTGRGARQRAFLEAAGSGQCGFLNGLLFTMSGLHLLPPG